jgi:tetrahydromethanopterin S-methyltransferase subunit C
MSAGGSGGPATGGIDHNKIIIFGIIGALVGIYAAYFLVDTIGPAFSFIAGLGAICSIVWGASAVRRVSNYGLGTGVPSIGMLAIGTGMVASLFGMAVGSIAGPVISFATACVIGLVIGVLANRIIGMGIPIMEQSMTEIAGAGSLTIVALSTTMSGTFMIDTVLPSVIGTGYIAMIFIIGALSILHPFNANLGPDEHQDRTLSTGFEKGAIAVIIAGIVATTTAGAASIPTILVGAFIWYTAFSKFYEYIKRDAHKVVGTGLLPTEEELE